VAGREWKVEFHPKCEQWVRLLPQSDAEALLAAIRFFGITDRISVDR
jgi:hypothetical protein